LWQGHLRDEQLKRIAVPVRAMRSRITNGFVACQGTFTIDAMWKAEADERNGPHHEFDPKGSWAVVSRVAVV
jgi:hypothetical protein